MPVLIAAFVVGIVSGLRTMTPPAVLSWAAYLGWLPLSSGWASFMAHWIAVLVFTVLALGEYVADKLPKTPSRTVPVQFGGRILSGAFSGAVLGAAFNSTSIGLVVGAIGAVIGTFGGYHTRKKLAHAIGDKDMPIALLEDGVALLAAVLVIRAVS
jgi:uncharacterized membrane protein